MVQMNLIVVYMLCLHIVQSLAEVGMFIDLIILLILSCEKEILLLYSAWLILHQLAPPLNYSQDSTCATNSRNLFYELTLASFYLLILTASIDKIKHKIYVTHR